jgi:protein disulfide-isomerase-like protein
VSPGLRLKRSEGPGRTHLDEVVKDAGKDVLVLFCVPWCSHCSSLLEEYQKLAEHFADSKSVVIAKIDATSNDVAGIVEYPTIKLYSKEDKLGKLFEGSKSYEDILEFVNNAGSRIAKDEL